MTEAFEWRCVILDDQPQTVADIRDALIEHGLQCTLGPPPDRDRAPMVSLGENLAPQLQVADVVLIDMQWKTMGRHGTDTAAAKILSERIGGSTNLFKAWCKAYASAEAPDRSTAGDDQVGYSLGAAISQLNPNARLIFVSTVKSSGWSPIVSTLQFFEPAPYAITNKDPVSKPVGAVMAALMDLQRLLVARNREVRRWLIAQVLLPVSLGLAPREGWCAEVWPDRDLREHGWALDPKKLLPQFHVDDEWNLDMLIHLLPKRAWQLPVADRLALKSLSHTLVKYLAAPDRMALDATRLRAQCALAGVAGQRVLIPLEHALNHPTSESIKTVINEVNGVGHNNLSALSKLCLEYGGDFRCDPELYANDAFRQPTAEAQEEPLPFDLFHLRMAVDALVDNHQKLRNGAGDRRLSMYVGRDFLTVVYSDDSPGFSGRDAVAACLQASLERADPLDRGLPLALSFPFFYPVISSAIALSDHSWLTLCGEERGDWAIQDLPGASFRVAWTFALTRQNP